MNLWLLNIFIMPFSIVQVEFLISLSYFRRSITTLYGFGISDPTTSHVGSGVRSTPGGVLKVNVCSKLVIISIISDRDTGSPRHTRLPAPNGSQFSGLVSIFPVSFRYRYGSNFSTSFQKLASL